jgi:chromosome segregation ATPase
MSSNNPANSSDPQVQATQNQNPQGQAPNSNGQVPNETPNHPTTEELQRQIKELRNENASHRKKFKDQEEANSAAEQARMAEQGQFKELAAKHEARVKELEPISTSYKALSERVNAQIDTQVKDWPAEVKSLVPSSETPVEQRLEQLERLRPLVDKLQLQAQGTQRGNAPNPKPTGQVGDPATKEDTVKRLMRSGMYGF